MVELETIKEYFVLSFGRVSIFLANSEHWHEDGSHRLLWYFLPSLYVTRSNRGKNICSCLRILTNNRADTYMRYFTDVFNRTDEIRNNSKDILTDLKQQVEIKDCTIKGDLKCMEACPKFWPVGTLPWRGRICITQSHGMCASLHSVTSCYWDFSKTPRRYLKKLWQWINWASALLWRYLYWWILEKYPKTGTIFCNWHMQYV